MIDTQGRTHYLLCDVCGFSQEDDGFDSFKDAVDYKKTNGWRTKIIGDDWVDRCPECIEN